MADPNPEIHQQQFLQVMDRDTAAQRFAAALRLTPLGIERIPLAEAWGRVLAQTIFAGVNVPPFDRSNFDGFAVRAEDTYGAAELKPCELRLNGETLATAVIPQIEVEPGTATPIATGAMLPRGADAVVMIEWADVRGNCVKVQRAVTAGSGVAFAGSDMAVGETVMRAGQLLSSRDTGVLAALGVAEVDVWRRPRVAIFSTGNEIVAPGASLRPGCIYDSNATVLCDAVRELGAVAWNGGILPDQAEALATALDRAVQEYDAVILSGGTSKGAGDLSYQALQRYRDPGIVAHGVALKPGKPICLAASQGKPVVILPGFPTSAIFTFHEFVAPVLRQLAGLRAEQRPTMTAQLPFKVRSEIGRTEFLLVSLVAGVEREDGSHSPCLAYPMGKGSGSVTTFSQADGFVTIDRHQETLEAGTEISVQLLGATLRPADLVVIGSHCLGLDWLLSELERAGWRTKALAVGSTAGLEAARRGECDLAGIHLLDPQTQQYNVPLLDDRLLLVPGYAREQGLVYRTDDPYWREVLHDEAWSAADESLKIERWRWWTRPAQLMMVNRNQGSGTRILLDQWLAGDRPSGYSNQVKSHTAVAAAVAQGRADWGIAIRSAAAACGLGFVPLVDEQYDFVVPRSRRHRPAVEAFCQLLNLPATREHLRQLGLRMH